jgi:hypothetical protein
LAKSGKADNHENGNGAGIYMNRTKCFLAALAVVAAAALAAPQAALATANAPAAADAGAAGAVDSNAPVKEPDHSLEAPWLANQPAANTPHNANPMDDFYVGPVDQGGETATLDTPHRSQGEVADFLVHAITEILSMGVDPTDKSRKKPWTYEDHLQMLSMGLDANALADLGSFMEKSNILQTLQANNLLLRVIVDDQPLLLNKGAVDGSYRWLYEMPVTLSFLTPGVKSYENASTRLNQHVIIRMQVGRVPKKKNKGDPGIDEMMIQSFSVKQNPDYKQP